MSQILYRSVRLGCDVGQAFEMFTINEYLQSWLTTLADVEPREGGKYELFWNPDDKENNSTVGCKITALERNKFLAFNWKGPLQFKDFMNTAIPLTHVVVFFLPYQTVSNKTCTEIHLIHSGWGDSAEWKEARLWFKEAWDKALDRLREYVSRA